MRLLTIRLAGRTTAARQEGDEVVEIAGHANVGTLLRSPDWREVAASAGGRRHPAMAVDLAPVVPSPGKIFCVGLNYRTHILEMGRPLPEFPTLFAKFADALIGPTDDIVLPPEETVVDWEGELAVVIGRAGRRVKEADAATHIAGYTVCNDVSMRTWQFRTKEWLQGKTWERSTPLGPALVTPDEHTPGAMITTTVDGVEMQRSSTADLVHSPEFLVSYISTITTLRPGDVIITGTPGGVGYARTPPIGLTSGQLLETSIEGLGTLRNRVRAEVR
jgi:acylpyruvate hydrolase